MMRTLTVALGLLALASLVPQAQAQDGFDQVANSCYRNQRYIGVETGRITYERVWMPCVQRRSYYDRRDYGYYGRYEGRADPTRVYSYARRNDDLTQGPRCLLDAQGRPIKMSATGVEAYSTEKAKEEADQALMEAIRGKHGSRFMDLENSVEKIYECWKSATGNRASEKAADFGGKTLRQCTVEAIPCRPDRIHVEEEERRDGPGVREEPRERRPRLIRRMFPRSE